MSDVVSMAHDTGTQWLDGLLKSVSTACQFKNHCQIFTNIFGFRFVDICSERR